MIPLAWNDDALTMASNVRVRAAVFILSENETSDGPMFRVMTVDACFALVDRTGLTATKNTDLIKLDVIDIYVVDLLDPKPIMEVNALASAAFKLTVMMLLRSPVAAPPVRT